MNPDIPNLEVSTRLNEVWPAEENRESWWYNPDGDSFRGMLISLGHPALSVPTDAIPARTIGEMLEEVKREGWYGGVKHYSSNRAFGAVIGRPLSNGEAEYHRATDTDAANALATALAESLEKKRERP